MRSLLVAFVVPAVAFALTGCSGGTPPSPALNGAPGADKVAPAAFGEVLKSTKTVVTKQSCIAGSGTATLSFKGTAQGPFPGPFTANGTWNFYSAGGAMKWTFSESFKITGAHAADGTITGNGSGGTAKCKSFGPVSSGTKLKYHLGTASGAATTSLIKNGATVVEKLH